MENKLIVIEGLDGVGKTTQFELLKKDFPDYCFITFPYYDTPSGEIIKNYLGGIYKEQNPKTSAYSASCFYAVDRYTSFKTHWENTYRNNLPIISARYVSSNAIYQMTKLEKTEWDNYLEWLFDLEYNKLAMPKPTDTLFLDMPVEISQKLLTKRYDGHAEKKDIHEANVEFMEKCRQSALYVAEKCNWSVINCACDNEPLSIEIIHEALIEKIKGILNA